MPPRRQLAFPRTRYPRTRGAAAGLSLAYAYKKYGTTGYRGFDALGAATTRAANAVKSAYKNYKSKKKPASVHQNAKLQVPGHGAGGTFTSVYMKKPLTKWLQGMKKNTASNFSYVNGAKRLSTASASQSYTTISSTFNATDLALLFQSTNNTCRTLVESVTENNLYRNQSNNDCFLVIYDVIARRDLSSTTLDYLPSSAWYDGAPDTGMTSAATFYPGATPFAVPRFTQYFDVKKVSHIILPAGGCHNHRIHYEPNRMISREVIADNNQNVKGLTMYSLAVIYGAPDNDLTAVNVTSGSAVIDFVQTKQYKWTYMTDAVTNNNYSNSLNVVPTEYVMQDESGTAQPVIAA